MINRSQKQIIALALVRQNYTEFILCNKFDPYKKFMQEKGIKAIAGIADSNLIAMVKIKNSGKKILQYRRIANRILFNDLDLQSRVCHLFSEKYVKIFFSEYKNPVLIRYDGTIERTVWHHSPNHILTISLIPEYIHLNYKKKLHIDGKNGGNAMYSIYR